MVDMASGALQMAKQSAEAQYGLTTRNATTSHYGGGINEGIMSKAERAQFVMEIASSFGIIKKPMQDVLNKLTGEKDTAALGRVASGNWESTGTDKGWMLQQITNQMSGLPPSIKQAMQATLLNNNSGEIQNKTDEQKSSQNINADYKDRAERQTAEMFRVTSSKDTYSSLQGMDENLNKMQVQMVNTGVQFAGAITKATDALIALPQTIKKVAEALESLSKHAPDSFRAYIPRLDK